MYDTYVILVWGHTWWCLGDHAVLGIEPGLLHIEFLSTLIHLNPGEFSRCWKNTDLPLLYPNLFWACSCALILVAVFSISAGRYQIGLEDPVGTALRSRIPSFLVNSTPGGMIDNLWRGNFN